jgi:predicted nucleic acid-binding protein
MANHTAFARARSRAATPALPRLSRALLELAKATTDAHLAALAIEHGATLGSFDRDFERFSGLRVEVLG